MQRRRAEKEDLEAHQLDSVLSTSTVKSLTDGYAVVERHGAYPESSPFVYGLGLRTKHYQGHELISHGGDVSKRRASHERRSPAADRSFEKRYLDLALK